MNDMITNHMYMVPHVHCFNFLKVLFRMSLKLNRHLSLCDKELDPIGYWLWTMNGR